MKNIVTLLSIGMLLLFACKKDKQLSAFDKATYEDILAFEPELNNVYIPVKSFPADEDVDLKSGSVLFYKTNDSRLGKLKIVSINDADTDYYSITIDFVTYDDQGNALCSKNNILVNNTMYYDLDIGENSGSEIEEFLLGKPNPPGFAIVRGGVAKFCVYSR